MAEEARVQVPTTAQLQKLAEAIPHIVWTADATGHTDYFNQRGLDYTGRDPAELLGWGWIDLVHPDDVARARATWERSVDEPDGYETTYRVRRHDGTYRWMASKALPVRHPDGRVARWIGTWTDIDNERRLQNDLRAAQQRTRELLVLAEAVQAAAPVATGLVDRQFRIVRFNDTLADLIGLSSEQDRGRPASEAAPDLWRRFEWIFRRVLDTREPVVDVAAIRRGPTGEQSYWHTTYYPVLVDAEVVGVGLVGVDVTERKHAEDFRTVVLNTMAEGLYAIDAGGRVTMLNLAACRMLGRTADELVGAPAHESFHYQRADGTPLNRVVCPIRKVLREGRSIRVADDAFTRADGSIFPVSYSASPLGDDGGHHGAVVVFRDTTEDRAQRHRAQRELTALTWLGRIREALDEERLVLYSQPIVSLTGAPAKEELLLRMATASGKIIPPGSFLPVAERYGLVEELDRWVLLQAVELAAQGRRVQANLSAWTITNVDLLPIIERALRERGADPSNLVCEITETVLLEDVEACTTFARGLREMGCGLALDDFGTGFGGFTHLKNLPITDLKIDIEFVRDLVTSPGNQHVVQAIVNLAKAFDADSVAEGVEDQATLDLLAHYGVDFVQGFHVGVPAPVDTDR